VHFLAALASPLDFFLPGAGMAFDNGDTREAETIRWSTLTYPVSVAIAVLLWRKARAVLFIPLSNLLALFGSGLLR